MRTFHKTVCLVVALTASIVSDASAQRTYQQPSVRSSENVARASWTPNRPAPKVDVSDSQVRRASTLIKRKPTSGQTAHRSNAAHTSSKNRVVRAGHTQRTSHGKVRQAQHVVHGSLPAPTRPVGSILHGPISSDAVFDGGDVIHEGTVVEGPIQSYPIDGQIDMPIVHGGGCDGGVGCGCGIEVSCGLDAGCDSIGACGTGGCKTSCGGNCSMCGELNDANVWRPSITLQFPQDGWISFEFLTWWQDGMRLPSLVTTSDGNNIARGDAGVLGRSTTRTLFGGNDVLSDSFSGGRLRFGFWLDRCHTWGVGGEYFNIGDESEAFSSTSTGSPILARPFFNTQTGLNDSELVAFPGVVSGTVEARATSELWGGGFHFRRLRCCQEGCKAWLFCGCPDHFCSRTETTFGYRYLQLSEGVSITENLVSTDTANPGTFDILDDFNTRNQFNGLDVGWKYRMTRGYWTYEAMLRMAFGNTRQTVRINGETTINDPAALPPTTHEGGLLAQSSNSGLFKQNEFSVVPEFNAMVGYQLTDHLRATLGYTFIYWSNVVRPGDHIDTDLNPNLLPPPADPFVGVQRPGFSFDTTDYWVQGLSYGLEYRW